MGERALPLGFGILGAAVGSLLGAPTIGFAVGSMVGGGIGNALAQYKLKKNRGGLGSQNYSWDRVEVTATSGTPVPLVYGEHRVAGNIVAQFISQNFKTQDKWNDPRIIGELSYETQSTLVVSTVNNDVKGIKLHLYTPSDPFLAYQITYPPFSVRVEIKPSTSMTYTNMGQFVVTPPKGEIILVHDADGNPFDLAKYDIRLTRTDLLTTGKTAFEIEGFLYKIWRYPSEIPVHLTELREVSTVADERSYLNTLVSLSEGEIESISGVKVGNTSVDQLGDTAFYEYRRGTPGQAIMQGFNNFSETVIPNVDMKAHPTWYNYTTTQVVDEMHFEFTAPYGMFHISTKKKKKGKVYSWSTNVIAESRVTGSLTYSSLFQYYIVDTVQSSKKYPIRIKMPEGLKQYDLRFAISDSKPIETGPLTANQVYLTRVNEIRNEQFRYPNTALLGMWLVATSQVQGNPPNITAVVKGIKVKNLDTQVTEWSDNPAWIIADILTNRRYGLGEYINESHLDAQTFIDAAAFYDELVNDGKGNQVKRITFNGIIDTDDTPQQILSSILAASRSFLVWSNGKFKLRPDKHETAVQAFTMDNIEKGSLTFSYTPEASKANQVEVEFRDSIRDWEKDSILVETPEASIGSVPLRKKSASLIGVTRYHQAFAIARHALLVSQHVNIQTAFSVGADSLFAEAGDIITVSHDTPGWSQKYFRIVAVEEERGGTLKLVCMEHHESIYSEINFDAPIPSGLETPQGNDPPPPVDGLEIKENVSASSPLSVNVVGTFTPPTGGRGGNQSFSHANIYMATQADMEISGADPGRVAKKVGESRNGHFEIRGVTRDEGAWVFVTSVNQAGIEQPISKAARSYYFVTGKSKAPPPVTSKFWGSQHEKIIHLHWNPVDDIGLTTFDCRVGLSWDSGVPVAFDIASNSLDIPVVKYGSNTFHLRSKDEIGQYSTPISVTVEVDRISRRRIIIDRDEIALANGTFLNMVRRECALKPGPTNAETVGRTGMDAQPGTAAVGGAMATGSITCVAGNLINDGETVEISDGVGGLTIFEFDKDAITVPGNIPVAITNGDAAHTVASQLAAAINGAPSFFVTASNTPLTDVVNLNNDYHGVHGNLPINSLVADPGFIVGGMSGGINPVPAQASRTAVADTAPIAAVPIPYCFSLSPTPEWNDGYDWNDPKKFWDVPTVPYGDYITPPIDLEKELCIEIHVDAVIRTFDNWYWDGAFGNIPVAIPGPNGQSLGPRHPAKWGLPGLTWDHHSTPEFHIDVSQSDNGVDYGPFYNITSGAEICCRAFKVMVTLKTDTPWVPIEIEKLRITVDMPERVYATDVQFNNELCKEIIFPNPFFIVDSVVAAGARNIVAHVPFVSVAGMTVKVSNTYTGLVRVIVAGV